MLLWENGMIFVQLFVLATLSFCFVIFEIDIGEITSPPTVLVWSIAQWTPLSMGRIITEKVWTCWNDTETDAVPIIHDEVPILNISDIRQRNGKFFESVDFLSMAEEKLGKDWRSRPLLLKGLWQESALTSSNTRRLSLKGLLKETLTVPYFTDATKKGALQPDSYGRICDIVQNISKGFSHKIGSQYMLQQYPTLINEVAPTRIVTQLFGDYFKPSDVTGNGLFPGLTTVPLFVADSSSRGGRNTTELEIVGGNSQQPRTELHCEPIGNVAVQLEGGRSWILVPPERSLQLKPSLAADGRAFFASHITDTDLLSVQRYEVHTSIGDALWIPTWYWHRVDYKESVHPVSKYDSKGDCDSQSTCTFESSNRSTVSIGASLFHFRGIDFVKNNPLFAILIVPALIQEIIGLKTQ